MIAQNKTFMNVSMFGPLVKKILNSLSPFLTKFLEYEKVISLLLGVFSQE